MSQCKQRTVCVLSDYVTVSVALLLFNVVRHNWFAEYVPADFFEFMSLDAVLLGHLFIPPMVLLVFYLSGYYYDVVFRSRLNDLLNTLITTFFAALLIYFAIVSNDPVVERGETLTLIGILWGLMFVCVYPVRLLLTLFMVRRLQKRKYGYRTLVVGTTQSARDLAHRLNTSSGTLDFNVIGFVNVDSCRSACFDDFGLPVYEMSELQEVIAHEGVTRLIVRSHRQGKIATMELLNSLYVFGLPIFISHDLFNVVTGKVSFGNIKGEPLINIASPSYSPCEASIKRFSDVLLSIISLILLLPFFAVTALAIKIDSKGPVFFSQDRVGLNKRHFRIYKFRSMRTDAEANGPALSSADDPRVTRVGRFIRRYRIDELPQFFNVLKGDMSLVGPRPEREYYISQIVKQAPYYTLIHQVRPGITSLGMVKFGYAATVEEMVRRVHYDLIYLENASLGMDLKIIFYTIRTVLTGKGV